MFQGELMGGGSDFQTISIWLYGAVHTVAHRRREADVQRTELTVRLLVSMNRHRSIKALKPEAKGAIVGMEKLDLGMSASEKQRRSGER